MRSITPEQGSSAVTGDGLVFVIILAAIALSVLFLYHIDPGQSSLLPPCLFHELTGLYCPGCGSLRALHELVHGNLAAAIRLNPLAIAALPFLAYAWISYGVRTWIKKPAARRQAKAFWIWLLLAAIIAFWFARNIPVYPFTLLSP